MPPTLSHALLALLWCSVCSSPPKAGTLSASKSLNAAILAKKEAEQKAAEERKAKQEALEALNKPIVSTHLPSSQLLGIGISTCRTLAAMTDRYVQA